MGERSDSIVNLKEDKRVEELRKKVNELRILNTQLRKKTLNKGIPTNVRDDLFTEIEQNKDTIEELISEMKKPTIVPVTGTTTVAEHKYEEDSNFKSTFVRI